MRDAFGREINYLRLSVTDRCDLRCAYCVRGDRAEEGSLTFGERVYIVSAFARLGIKHVRVTGGEPLLYPDCAALIAAVKSEIGRVTLTTNGTKLAERAADLRRAGIDAINVSLDTLDRAEYAAITGADALNTVLNGVETALSLGIRIKINAVSISEKFMDLLKWVKNLPIDLRFIEKMPIGGDMKGIPHDELFQAIKTAYPQLSTVHGQPSTAKYYKIDGFKGRLGFISPISQPFCDNCNRLRLTHSGYLKTCLCYADGADLRPFLNNAAALESAILAAAAKKPRGHCFGEPEKVTETKSMSAIGG